MGLTLGVTGRRPKYFPWKYNENDYRCQVLKRKILDIVISKVNEGYDRFVTGMALGVDTYFAEAVLDAKDISPDIKLICEIPFNSQSNQWKLSSRFRYESIHSKSDEWNVLSESYSPSSFIERDKLLVDKSDCLLVIWDGIEEGGTYHTYKYALESNKPVIVIDYTKL